MDEESIVPDLSGSATAEAPKQAAAQQQRRGKGKRALEQLADELPDLPSSFMAASNPAAAGPPPATPQPQYKKWRVVVDAEMPWPRGAGFYTMERGRVLSEQHYDIAKLVKMGLKLELVEE